MKLDIRPADLVSDRAELVGIIGRNLPTESSERRFDWLYLEGPHGKGHAWVARNSQSSVVGLAALFPRRFSFAGEEFVACVLGDFCFDEKYRSLGPAIELQRTCLRAATASPFGAYYDFPSTKMMTVYKRIGIAQTGSIVRWAKLIRANHYIQSRVSFPRLAQGLSFIANIPLSWHRWRTDLGDYEMSIQEELCGPEFTALDAEVRKGSGLRTVRSAEYLNWRYKTNPGTAHNIMTARKAGALVGYAVITSEGALTSIADLCASVENAERLVPHLLTAVAEYAHQDPKTTTISMVSGVSHPWSEIFRKAGFRQRDHSPLVAYADKSSAKPGPLPGSNWYLMQGERDS